MKHKDDDQVTGDNEHGEKEDDDDFQQACVEDLRVTNVQQAEGHSALVQLSCVHLVKGVCGHTRVEEGFLGGGLTQQILPRLLLAPADGIDMPVPDVCHLSRNTSHSFPQSTLILLYTGLQKVYNLGYDRSHNARSDRMIQFITTWDRHQHPPPSPLTSSVQFLPFPGEAQL